MQREEQERQYWTVVRIDSYDHDSKCGVMRVVSWYGTPEEAKRIVGEANDPGMIAFPKPFHSEPDTTKRYRVPGGLDPELDREVERVKKLSNVVSLNEYRNRRDRGPKFY